MGMAQDMERYIPYDLERLRKQKRVSVRSTAKPGHRKAARVKRRIHFSQLFAFVLITALLTTLTTILLIRYASLSEHSKDLYELQQEITELEADRDYLMMQIEPYKSSERIEQLAKKYFMMDYPNANQIIYLDLHKQGTLSSPLTENQ